MSKPLAQANSCKYYKAYYICNEIDIPEITNNNILSKRQMKSTIQEAITEQIKNNMLSFRKVAERVSDDSSDNNYLDRMGLTHSRI